MDQLAQRMRSYVDSLEEEKLKIQVFQRELPLCLDLVNKAIENYRQQLSGTTTECPHGGQSECSEQTSTQGPVLEEFMPIKRNCSCSDNDEDAELDSGRKPTNVKATVAGAAAASSDNKRKSDWLRSVQLWNQTAPDPPPKDDPPPKKVPVLEVKRSRGAFHPFNREQGPVIETSHTTNKQFLFSLDKVHSAVPPAAASSTVDTAAASGLKEEREPAQPNNRKQRRNWSPELHRSFLQALEQLGGSHAATPKQIRELMKFDGLTNDEVKSHLQKYRLHTRRPGPCSTVPAAGTEQAPQFVVVGGIWVPPVDNAGVVAPASSGDAAKVYLPTPTPGSYDQKKQPYESEGRGSHSAGGEEEGRGARSDLQSTSSSSHTTTTSRSH